MALSHAILAVLSDHTCSGYDLAKQFDGSVGFFWNASHQQIYRELSKLEQQGMIESQEVEQSSRPNKKMYLVTPEGKAMLCNWIIQPSKVPPVKDELLIKLFVGYLVPRDEIMRLLQEQRSLHLESLETYRSIEQEYFTPSDALSETARFQYLTLRNGIHFEQGWLAWCEEAIATLSET